MLAEFALNQRMLETMLIFAIPIVGVLGVFGWLITKTLSDHALKQRMVD